MFRATVSPIFKSTSTVYTTFWNDVPTVMSAADRWSCWLLISLYNKSYCSTVHFRRITSIYQPTNAHIISHKTLLKHFKTLRLVSILSDHHQGVLFLAKVIIQYSQFNSYLQTWCCGSISCFVGMCCGAVARCAS